MNYQLKEKYRINFEDEMKIKSFMQEIMADNHALLNGKKITTKLSRDISEMYYKYLRQESWSSYLLEMELKYLRHDSICGDNTNKKPWCMAYMLEWLLDIPVDGNIDMFYSALTSRETYRILLSRIYEGV